jgi:predicted  nucleic acid-binding Zn-ribbon protein
MTVDERIEALLKSFEMQKERHDALAQSVELVVSMHRDGEIQAAEIRKEMAAIQKEMAAIQKNSDARLAKLDEYFAAMMQSMMRLSNITAVHDMHIDDHEHRIGGLEEGR